MVYSGTNTEQLPSVRVVVVATSQVLQFMETALGDYLGAASQYLNLKSIMFQLVENRINGDVMASCIIIKKQLAEYGLDVKMLDEVFDAVLDQMNRIFNLSFEYDISEYVCNFNLIGRGDTRVEVLKERQTASISLADRAVEYIEEAEENFDFIPERVRRALEAIG